MMALAKSRAARLEPRRQNRLGPRPLALHLALARAARGTAPGLAADFARGMQAYWCHPHRRAAVELPALWRLGSSRLLDYGPGGGLPLLVVPSLINRAHVLDLLPGCSLLGDLRARGVRPLLLDWGAPGAKERRMTLSDYVVGRLEPALERVRAETRQRPIVLGYCMGGLLALALAVRRPHDLAGLALLATPWDFHADGVEPADLAALMRPAAVAAAALGGLPVDLIQALFAAIDPLGVAQKFARSTRPRPRR